MRNGPNRNQLTRRTALGGLVVTDSDEGFGDGASGSWQISNAKPDGSVLASVTRQNTGALHADHVEFGFSVTET